MKALTKVAIAVWLVVVPLVLSADVPPESQQESQP